MSRNLTKLSSRKGVKNNLFEKIQEVYADKEAPSKKHVQELAREYLVGDANILGASSFYDFLKESNRKADAYVCNGTACMIAGTQESVKNRLMKESDISEIGHACCLGRCHENAAFQLNDINYSGEDILHLPDIISKKTDFSSKEQMHAQAYCAHPVMVRNYENTEGFYETYQDSISYSPDDLLKLITTSGLRGRGGAGYPLALKMEACKNAVGKEKFIVCNADEGDPGSYSDRYLMEYHPHLMLFGMLISGYICGAETGIIYIRAEYPNSIKVVEEAVNSFRKIKNRDHNNWPFDFKIIRGAGSYICGEETALLASIEGQRPEVRIRPPFPTEYGLYGMPTLVNNVETLSNLHFILKYGSDEYRKQGTASSTGSKLICLDGFFNQPGVYEVPFGISLNDIIEKVGRGFTSRVKALHIGGPLGGVVPHSEWNNLTLDFESFEQAGFSLGHASFISIPEEYPMIKYLEHLFEFTAHESCGKCFPCRLGSQRGKELIQKAQFENFKIGAELFSDLLETMTIGSLCGLGSGLPLPVKNILNYFSRELEEYFDQFNKLVI